MAPFTVSGLTGIINQLLPEPHAGLLSGLLFGVKANLPRDFYDALVTTGTLHIIALSGMNISIMEDLVATMLRSLIGTRIAGLITMILIVWFVWFVGPSPSIVRAAIMGSISLLAVLFGRQYWAILSWVLAIATMLLINWSWIGNLSFQLSALATLGIILFGPKKDTGKNGLMTDLRLTLAAQTFTVPLIFFQFRRISLVSAFANLAIGWLIAPLTMLGWATVLVGWLLLYAGQVLAWFDWVLLEYLVRIIYLMSKVPFASIGW